MMAVPRRSKPAAAAAAPDTETPATELDGQVGQPAPASNGSPAAVTHAPETNGHALVPADAAPLALPAPGVDASRFPADPGLYAVLGLDPSASDAEIQTTYRRRAARLLNDGQANSHAMRELNGAVQVLGNPVRRAEYDRLRQLQSGLSNGPTPIRLGAKAAAPLTRRRRPRTVVQPRYAGLTDVVAVLMVVGLAVLAGALIIPRLSINLSALNVLQNVLPLTNSNTRRVLDAATPSAAATLAPTATPRPGLVERFAGVSVPDPPQNTPETVLVRLRRDGQPASNFDVWAVVQYRTVEERWPATGSIKTDGSGTASISFNVGAATPNYPVQVRVYAQVDDTQQLTWSTSFTPR
jgi:hypothetical protein